MPVIHKIGAALALAVTFAALAVVAPPAAHAVDYFNTDPHTTGCAGNVYNLNGKAVPGGTLTVRYSRTCSTNWIEYRGTRQTVSKRIKDSRRNQYTRTETDTGTWSYSMQVVAPGTTSVTAQATIGATTYTASCAASCSWSSSTAAPAPAASVLTRAKSWVDARVPYSQTSYYANQYGRYRQDCSGFVSMAWNLGSSYVTGTLPQRSYRISKADLRPGDALINTSPGNAGHAILFVRWADTARTKYVGYEESGYYGRAVQSTVPYPYWSGTGTFLPYRKR